MAELIQPQMGLNFEQVWAAFMETRQQIKEAQQETDRQMKVLQKNMGELGNRFGELAEHLVIPNIVQKFNALNYISLKTRAKNANSLTLQPAV